MKTGPLSYSEAFTLPLYGGKTLETKDPRATWGRKRGETIWGADSGAFSA